MKGWSTVSYGKVSVRNEMEKTGVEMVSCLKSNAFQLHMGNE